MFIKQFYTGCLSEAAYYIESQGQVAVIDPLRDIDPYIQLAKERNATIKYIFETHFHADFISGHVDLARFTGAPIIYGPGTKAGFDISVAKDGQIFQLGDLKIEVLHTPGHTLESSCFLLKDENGKPHCIFTGDTLFVGDVGRPDLAQKNGEHTMEDMAALLYDSLQGKIIPMPDDVIVYPAHGPGSACGKNLGPATFSTIAVEKETNYALKTHDKEKFVAVVTAGLTEPPKYFPINAQINKEGYETMNTILKKSLNPLSPKEFKSLLTEDILIVDTRSSEQFSKGFIPGSIFIGLEGRFAEWAGSLLPFSQSILLVTVPGMEQETVTRLARVGIDKVRGYLEDGIEAWKDDGNEIDLVIDVEPDELMLDMKFDENLVIVDVRRETEFADGHLKNAINIPLNELTDPATLALMEETQNIYVHCAGGYRSMIATSLMKRQGIHNLRNVLGGWNEIKKQEKLEIIKEKSVLN
ncbi:MAG: MBL fold metallo-hydrolase [Chitinophagaceae bacterium]|jgi:glyoxylase-like metal-dependent hydrolase (beta-lactamase superfamily II)/rhodanese-related sulfurtransferase|nr:MBL fold metallo-hydrolase [Chitinophagaceae bacterium]